MNRTTESPHYSRVRRADNTETPTAFPAAFQQRRREYDAPQEGQDARRNVFGSNRHRDSQRGYSSHHGGGQSYRGWKNNDPDPAKPKEVNLSSTTEFPSLGGLGVKTPSVTPSVSLAEKLKESIQREQEEVTQRRYAKNIEKPSDDVIIPLSTSAFMRRRMDAKRAAEDTKLREIEEEERRYRWNVSKEMYPSDNEDETDYHKELDQNEEDETCFDHDVDN